MKTWKIRSPFKLKRLKLNVSSKLRKSILAIILIALIVLQVGTFFSFNQQTYAESLPGPVKVGLDLDTNYSALLPTPDPVSLQAAMELKPKIEEQERKAAIRAKQISGLVAFLKRQKSPVATEAYAAQIIDLAQANGADYRIVVAIMGVESGFCRAPFKINGANSHNCFGYLNKVTYSSFSNAFNDLVPKISRQYANRFGWNFEGLAKAYGQFGWEKTSADMLRYASSL